jgi:hypothetical protein
MCDNVMKRVAKPVLFKISAPVECLMVGDGGHVLFQGTLEKIQPPHITVVGVQGIVLATNSRSHLSDGCSRINTLSSPVQYTKRSSHNLRLAPLHTL